MFLAPAQQQDVFVAPVYTKKKVPHMGSIFWISGTPPRNEKKIIQMQRTII
jgi:hypothetical protein